MASNRLQTIQQVQQLRAEMLHIRNMLEKLGNVAATAEFDNLGHSKDAPFDIRALTAEEATEKHTALTTLISSCYSHQLAACIQQFGGATQTGTKILPRKHTEMDSNLIAHLLASCEPLVCKGLRDDKIDGHLSELLGCCLIKRCSSGPNNDGEATPAIGQVMFLAVPECSQQRQLESKLLEAAEERLAAHFNCAEVRISVLSCFEQVSAQQELVESCGYCRVTQKDVACAGHKLPVEMIPAGLTEEIEVRKNTKTLTADFVSRSVAKRLRQREQELAASLASLELDKPLAVRGSPEGSQPQDTGSIDSCSDASMESAKPLITFMPQDVWVGIMSCLMVHDMCMMGSCCQLSKQEADDPELWRVLFLRSCWPASPALLDFVERDGFTVSDSEVLDFRSLIRKRTTAQPFIVVDVGRGYTKYGIVHGVNGRPDGDDSAPHIVQLCSSPTHPPDCEHGNQLVFIHRQLDMMLLTAARDLDDPLHYVAVKSTQPLAVGSHALLQGLKAQAELNGHVVHLVRFDDVRERWAVCLVALENWTERRSLSVEGSNLRRISTARDLPLLIGEPFAETANRRIQPRLGLDWASAIETQLEQARPGPVYIAPQAQMSLWAHGINHGIVINIGQQQTIAIPVVRGRIAEDAACGSNIGSAKLTQLMMSILQRRFNFAHSSLMTWCRDIKEAFCYVAPPASCLRHGQSKRLQSRLDAGDDFRVQSVTVDPGLPGMEPFELAEERVLVPEALFDSSMMGGPSLPELILRCAEQTMCRTLGEDQEADQEALQALLRNIVLVGGAADMPGLRPRTECEVRALLASSRAFSELRSALAFPEDAFVLQPPLGSLGPLTTPRFVPFVGGCVRAAGSNALRGAGLMERGPHGFTNQATGATHRGLMHRGLLHLNAPAVFRTGGGGGADDDGGDLWWGNIAPAEDFSDSEEGDLEEEVGDLAHDEDGDPLGYEDLHDEPTSEPLPFRPPRRGVGALQ
mmetsp:Transcript_37525/g.74485  ORF Transcript_37525/g.74485 Transcript_37525/m.74485 type:complete len:977 (-) Transcript_37525:101-3031(-)